MATLPSFILKRLYVNESLRNTPDGFEFAVRNFIGTGTILDVYGLDADGTAHPPNAVILLMPDNTARPGNEVTADAPLALAAGLTVRFRIMGERLGAGRHTLKLSVRTREMGMLDLPVSDIVREQATSAVTEPALAVSPPPEARPLKIALIGAGSTVFARQLMTDILCTPGLNSGTFALVDIDARRLELAHRIGDMLVRASGRRWRVEATTNRVKGLPGCDYVINSIEVAGLRNVRHDYDIPLKHGVDQCIGDTIGPGGIFKLLRTGPAWLEILRDIERLCPSALVMNYSNPLSALTLLALRATGLRVVGLCHSVLNTAEQLAGYLDVPLEQLRFRCAGINHLAWYTELRVGGEDVYPRLAERARDPEVYDLDPVRFEVMKHFGAFVTESSGHLSEYLPYFRKRPELIAKYTRGGYRGESGFYAKNWPSWRQGGDDSIRESLDGRSPLQLRRSSEYASTIIEAIELGRPRVIHGNVLNRGLIDNLPAEGCVEVPVLADASGLQPVRFGPLPAQMAALDRTHAAPHELMVAAVLDRDRNAALHALLLDPLTSAVCSLDEIHALFDEMWEAERDDLTWFER
ncbi:MAG: alpha-galactosidase [Spirochaetia bacterium]|jgi:alpha-galactosidase